MDRSHLVKQFAEHATRPLSATADAIDKINAGRAIDAAPSRDLFVWFEDTSARTGERRGVAGLPESLLPYSQSVRVLERRFAAGHMHLLAAVRLECTGDRSEAIAALYTAALSVGTIAWIGTGAQYERAWQDMLALGTEPRLSSSV